MTPYFLSSVTGNDGNDGLSWATAKATFQGIDALTLPADAVVFVDSAHVSTYKSGSPTRITAFNSFATPFVSVDRSQWPAMVQKAGAQFNFYNTTQTIYGQYIFRGITVNYSTLGNSLLASNADSRLEACNFSGGLLGIGDISNASANMSSLNITDSWYKPTRTNDYIQLGNGRIRWYGGGLAQGSAAIAYLINPYTLAHPDFIMDGADLSALPSNVSICANNAPGRVVLSNCKLPANWTGSLMAYNPPAVGQYVEMYNCDSAGTNYRIWTASRTGALRESTGVTKAGGATDGTTPLSWVITTNTNAIVGDQGGTDERSFATPEIAYWNDAIGSPLTLSVDVLADTTPLTSSEAWLEVSYLGDASSPKSSPTLTRTPLLGVATQHPASAAQWAGGPATPVAQKLQFTFTPQMKGFVTARVRIARPSATVYVDPALTVA